MHSISRIVKWFIFCNLLLIIAACTGIDGVASMQVWLDSPLDGSSFQLGDTVQLHTHARDVNGPGIDELHYFANDRLLAIGEADFTLPLVHSFMGWTPAAAGIYDVFIRAVSVSGATVESVHIKVTITGQQFKEMGQGPDSSSTPTITRPPVTPTRTTTQKIPTLTPSPTRTFNPTDTVTQRPPAVYLYADDTSLSAGECTTLTWETYNVNSATLDDMPLYTEFGSTQKCPMTNASYYLVGYYPGGSISDSVTIYVDYLFPLEVLSDHATLNIAGGHESIYYVGNSMGICYSYPPASYLFELRDYYPATPGLNGPFQVLESGSMYEGEDRYCMSISLAGPGGYKAFQFRVISGGGEQASKLIDYAEVWIYVVP